MLPRKYKIRKQESVPLWILTVHRIAAGVLLQQVGPAVKWPYKIGRWSLTGHADLYESKAESKEGPKGFICDVESERRGSVGRVAVYNANIGRVYDKRCWKLLLDQVERLLFPLNPSVLKKIIIKPTEDMIIISCLLLHAKPDAK